MPRSVFDTQRLCIIENQLQFSTKRKEWFMFRVPKHGGGSSSRVIKAYGQPKIGPPVKGRRSRCFGILFRILKVSFLFFENLFPRGV